MPIIGLMLVVVLSLALPRLPAIGQKILIASMTLPVGFCLYYMIVAPGWMPGTGRRGPSAWRVALFAGCAAAIVAGAGVFILRQ